MTHNSRRQTEAKAQGEAMREPPKTSQDGAHQVIDAKLLQLEHDGAQVGA